MRLKFRPRHPKTYNLAIEAGLSPLLAHILACRLPSFEGDINSIIRPALKYIDHPELLKDSDKAANRIALAIINQERVGILTDYDVDGVTSHAIIYRALTEHFAVPKTNIESLIGHRIKDGYGISKNLTDRILTTNPLPSLIITADCGSSDETQIARLKGEGIDVVVTDHHALSIAGLPKAAYAVVNPTQKDCRYPDSTIAGCMTVWLLMSYVRHKLIDQHYLAPDAPKLIGQLDYVSLGTVADCVSIGTAINRAVVKTGLHYMNRFDRACWRAMRTLLDKGNRGFSIDDLGFQIGPRINARSRLADPYAALRFLLADTDDDALHYLALLDTDNQDRKRIEKDMLASAKLQATLQLEQGHSSLVVYLHDGHAGVQGIVASRLVEAFGRPAIVLCDSADPIQLTGSARGIPEVHVREALQHVVTACPDIVVKFGGHRGAAGLTIYRSMLSKFQEAFEQAVAAQIDGRELVPVIWIDGTLQPEAISIDTLLELEQLQPYGRGFEPPIFEGIFGVEAVRIVGAQPVHLAITISKAKNRYQAIWFHALEAAGDPCPVTPGDTVRCAYRLSLNEFRGARDLRLMVEYASRENL